MRFILFLGILFTLIISGTITAEAQTKSSHTFAIGDNDFLLDNQRFQIRCGEIHFARVPEEYWAHRLKLCKAMGLNTVCAYLFWNYHESEPGKFNWEGSHDVVKFCQLAQKEGLWVILRPGPYACAEWEMGGLPWWLLKHNDIKLRTRDTVFMNATHRWMKEVGSVLKPLQITHGGPIIMVQVENEYGYYADDAEYMGLMRQSVIDAGFDVPLFACNPPFALKRGLRNDLFNVVNFGSNPEASFRALREIQPKGPLMCGEFYPGWFDTWGLPHHTGNMQGYLTDLDYMLKNNASFSIYMAHGGTTFGLWAGCDRPFKPDVSSYDYDAPISEAGWIGEKFQKTREVMAKYLLPGEQLPEPPTANPVIEIPEFELQEMAPVLENLPLPKKDIIPQNMEAYNQGQGYIVYRTTLKPGEACRLEAKEIRDFAWCFVDGKQVGVMDRRNRTFSVTLPKRSENAILDILVEPMGRVNFGVEVHDRKGLSGPVSLIINGKSDELRNWNIYNLDLNPSMLAHLSWQKGKTSSPAFWHGKFSVTATGDVFLDVSKWGKGILWVNDHCLGRFWNIGPTQTMYCPGVWLKKGVNSITVLDILGPREPRLTGLKQPILNQLHPELDFMPKKNKGTFTYDSTRAVYNGSFRPDLRIQEVKFQTIFHGRQFCIESVNAYAGSDQAAISELDILDENGNPLPHTTWTIAFADNEETALEDGSALNAINGQAEDYWITSLNGNQANHHPHKLVIDLGSNMKISGFRYTSRPGDEHAAGKIKDYRIYIGDELITTFGTLTDKVGYLFVYFTGNHVDEEAIRFAISNDGYKYVVLNNNLPVLDSKTISSTGGVRDPHILRGKDGKTFYMVATDMTSSKGWNSNRAMTLLKSTDLINWTSTVINIQQKYPGNEDLKRVWAPQTIFDEKAGKYMIYWAMKNGDQPDKIVYAYANEDFTDVVGAPKQLFFPSNEKSCIDADIILKDSLYHLFYKTEGNGNGIRQATTPSLTSGKWTEMEGYMQVDTEPVEGSCIFKLIGSDTYILMYDRYTQGKYQFTRSTSLDRFTVCDNQVSMNFHPRHGTVIAINSKELRALLQKWGIPEGFK